MADADPRKLTLAELVFPPSPEEVVNAAIVRSEQVNERTFVHSTEKEALTVEQLWTETAYMSRKMDRF